MPAVSIVVPTRARPSQLRWLLEGLARSTESFRRFEVLVAVDGPDEPTHDLLRRWSSPFRLRALTLPQRGQMAARNAAVAEADAPYVLFLDDDILPSPFLVGAHVAAQKEHLGVLAVGLLEQLPADGGDWYACAYAAAWRRHYQRLPARIDWADAYSGNLSAPTEAVRAVGGFPEDMPTNGDAAFAYRMAAAGYEILYVPAAAGVHAEDKTSAALVDSRVRLGDAAVQLVRRHPAAGPRALGWYADAPGRELILRRIGLTLRVRPRLLHAAGRLVARGSFRERWYGFVSNYAFWLGVRRAASPELWGRLTAKTPVLLYHAFAPKGQRGGRFVVSRRRFLLQMQALRALGYRLMTLGDLVEILRRHEFPPPRTAVVTMDDGYLDNHDVAYPILRRLGLTATVFVVSGRVGERNDWDDGELAGRPLLTWEHLRELDSAGIEIGAHTRAHPCLTDADPPRAGAEIAGSRAELEGELDGPVPVFAYPYGKYDANLVALARDAGYRGACTARPALLHPNGDPFEIDRIEIRGSDSLLTFLRKIRRGR
jgi:peptidoglycan/xylan/chitin deacetylase (PgdA/CDA1 family)/GT2 family glycosyltransferase